MNKIYSLFSLMLLSFMACKTSDTPASISLFEEHADTWIESGDAEWRFDDGVITGTASGEAGFLVTKDRYDNFELTLEFKPDSTVNSGVFVRCTDEIINPVNCHEMNIWDLHPNQDNRTGAIVTKVIPTAQVETIDKWNTYRIKCIGNQVTIWINEIQTAKHLDGKLLDGYIAIQAAETGVVKFRNVEIEELTK